ncbi:hypothetical protein [Corynebacterium terpenotabidum]|nr:hypothetical protein [Corynebacterium terpenotabidum]
MTTGTPQCMGLIPVLPFTRSQRTVLQHRRSLAAELHSPAMVDGS